MKNYSLFLALIISLMLLGCPSQHNKVLLILRESMDMFDEQSKRALQTDEAVVMKNMLEEAGFKVVTASASGQTFVWIFGKPRVSFKTLKLAEVKVSDYAGFIIPCMSIGTWTFHPEEVAIAKQAVATGKPVAAQHKGVLLLAQAGGLAGRRYAFLLDHINFKPPADAIYSGNGVVQDGNIITSGICPYGVSAQNVELTQAFIAELQK